MLAVQEALAVEEAQEVLEAQEVRVLVGLMVVLAVTLVVILVQEQVEQQELGGPTLLGLVVATDNWGEVLRTQAGEQIQEEVLG